jgi:acyl dehydratase
MVNEASAKDVLLKTEIPNLDLIPSHIDLVGAEIEMINYPNRELVLKNILDPIKDDYEFIVVDCSPSLGLITVNALTASDSVIIPVQCEFFALEGLGKLLNTIKIVQSRLNTNLEIEGILMTMYDGRLRLCNQVVSEVRKHFEDIEIGETVITAKRTVTEADIVNFSNVSWDHFYAHTDATSLDGTIFEGRVAHGYFVLSAAAGLFVDAKKGPVLLNYGLEECRFTKPVYPSMTIGVKLTVKEKVDQEKRSDDDVAKGIVKFLVDVYDETGETVAIATILTMVKKRNQEN